MAEDDKKLVRLVPGGPGGRLTPEDVARKAAQATIDPYAVLYARINAVVAVVICRCQSERTPGCVSDTPTMSGGDVASVR